MVREDTIHSISDKGWRCCPCECHVSVACNLIWTFLSYTYDVLSSKSGLCRGRTCSQEVQRMLPMQNCPWEFSGKGSFAHERERGQKKPCCGIFSACPAACSGWPSQLWRPCCWTELLADPWPHWCGMSSVPITSRDDSLWLWAAACLLPSPVADAKL